MNASGLLEQHCLGYVGPGHTGRCGAADGALVQGARVRRCLRRGHGGRRLPGLSRDHPEAERRGAPQRVRRGDTLKAAVVPVLPSPKAHALGRCVAGSSLPVYYGSPVAETLSTQERAADHRQLCV